MLISKVSMRTPYQFTKKTHGMSLLVSLVIVGGFTFG